MQSAACTAPFPLKTSEKKRSLKARPAEPKTRTSPRRRRLHTQATEGEADDEKAAELYINFLKGCFLNFLPYSPISASFFHFILSLAVSL